MNLKKCLLTANECYKTARLMKITGIVVHSTGANNPNLKRYVQPLASDGNYSTVIADLGKNIYGNHWNRFRPDGRQVCVHAFIGKNKNGVVETYQTLPYDISAWGVGSGSKGSYNYDPQGRIQFEICEDNLKNETYFKAAFKEAAEYCAHLCKTYKLDVNKISSHAESHKAGYGSNHSDCDHWLKKFGKDMNWFRAEVKKLLETPVVVNIKAGDLVSIKSGAKYYTGVLVPAWVQKQKWYVASVSGDKAIINKNEAGTNAINSPISTEYLTAVKATTATIKVGSTVKLKKGAKTYTGGNLASFVYNRNHKVKEISGERVVITYLGITVAAVKKSDLTLVK